MKSDLNLVDLGLLIIKKVRSNLKVNIPILAHFPFSLIIRTINKLNDCGIDFFAIRRGLARVIILFGHRVFQSCRLATAGAIVEERCFSRISRGPITYSVVLATLNLDVFKNHPAADFS